MFEFFGAVTSAYKEVLHLSEWTGLSVGALAISAAVIYFVPPLRQLAALVAGAVILGYVVAIYAYHLGHADTLAQWMAAAAQAQQAEKEREAALRAELEAKFSKPDDSKVDTDAENIIKGFGGSCPLGDSALQLRVPLPKARPGNASKR